MAQVNGVNIDPLLKAYNKFEEFRGDLKTEKDNAAAIQAFEYCFELVWKTMQRLLEARGKYADSPREAF